MCLIVFHDSKIKIANEDIVCYKQLININGKLYSPCYGFEYEPNKVYNLGKILKITYNGITYDRVEKGFHSFVRPQIGVNQESKNHWRPKTPNMLILNSLGYQTIREYKCIIPKGASFVRGTTSDGISAIVSNQIKILV